MRLRLSSRRSVISVVTFQAGTTAPVALVWSTHSTNRSNGNSSSKPIPFRGDATVTIQRATATARGRTAAQDIRRMLSLGQPPALAAAPMRSPALPTVPPYDDSRADADSPAVRSLPTRGPHLASRTAHADAARGKALLPQCAYTHSRKPSRYTHSLGPRALLCGFDCMRRHRICDGRCVARRLGPVGMIRLCACGVPASAHCFTAWNTATQATLHQKLKQMIEKEHRRAQILRQVGTSRVPEYFSTQRYASTPRAPQHRNAGWATDPLAPPRTSSCTGPTRTPTCTHSPERRTGTRPSSLRVFPG